MYARAGVKGAAILLPLLGLTWLFGLLAINKDLILFEYMFALFNSLQVGTTLTFLEHYPAAKMSSAIFLVCYNLKLQSCSKLVKI